MSESALQGYCPAGPQNQRDLAADTHKSCILGAHLMQIMKIYAFYWQKGSDFAFHQLPRWTVTLQVLQLTPAQGPKSAREVRAFSRRYR
jgi:hypothetical protein